MVRKHAGALAPILPRLQVELHVQEQVLNPNLATPDNVQLVKKEFALLISAANDAHA